MEGASLSFFGFDPDFAAHILHYFFCRGKPQSASGYFFHGVQALENDEYLEQKAIEEEAEHDADKEAKESYE